MPRMPRWTPQQLNDIFQRSNGRCRKCSRQHWRQDHRKTWNVDHVIPRAHGGTDEIANLAVNCIQCNSAKAANMTAWDQADTTANLVIERMARQSGGGTNARNNRSGNRNANTPRQATCPICGRGRNPKYAYCKSCHDKSGGRPIEKKFGECKYGRCHQPVVTAFFGIVTEDYCELHLEQHNRGLI